MKYLTFFIKLSEIVDHHVPLTKVTKKERTLQSKPWINKEIKHLMWKRDKLFQIYYACKNETQKKLIHEEFKKLRNNVTFSIRKSKNEYFKLFFDKNRNNTTLIWKGIRQLITLKSKSKIHLNIVKVKGKDITNPIEIVNAFSNFFINIGPNLSKSILDSNKPFKNFLKNSSLNSF